MAVSSTVIPNRIDISSTDDETISVNGSGQLQVKDSGISEAKIASVVLNSLIPIGTILPWPKSFTNIPSLPGKWIECNGQTLDDDDSDFHGQTIPDLNGDNRFLRGSSSSGSVGGGSSHTHSLSYGSSGTTTGGPNNPRAESVSTSSHLPDYYEVVWIMRIK